MIKKIVGKSGVKIQQNENHGEKLTNMIVIGDKYDTSNFRKDFMG